MNDKPTKSQIIFHLVMLVSITVGTLLAGILMFFVGDTVAPTYKCAPEIPLNVCNWVHNHASAIFKTLGAISIVFGLIAVVFAYFLWQVIARGNEPSVESPNIDTKPKNSRGGEYFVHINRSFYIEPGEMVVFERKPNLGEQTILPSTGERVEVCSIDGNIVVKPISDYLEKQAELFDRQLPELLPKYKGMYVFFEDGEVKDADFDEEALIERVLAKEGYRDIFVEKVV